MAQEFIAQGTTEVTAVVEQNQEGGVEPQAVEQAMQVDQPGVAELSVVGRFADQTPGSFAIGAATRVQSAQAALIRPAGQHLRQRR